MLLQLTDAEKDAEAKKKSAADADNGLKDLNKAAKDATAKADEATKAVSSHAPLRTIYYSTRLPTPRTMLTTREALSKTRLQRKLMRKPQQKRQQLRKRQPRRGKKLPQLLLKQRELRRHSQTRRLPLLPKPRH